MLCKLKKLWLARRINCARQDLEMSLQVMRDSVSRVHMDVDRFGRLLKLAGHSPRTRIDQIEAGMAGREANLNLRFVTTLLQIAETLYDKAHPVPQAPDATAQKLTLDQFIAEYLKVYQASMRFGPEGGKLVPSKELLEFYEGYVGGSGAPSEQPSEFGQKVTALLGEIRKAPDQPGEKK
jgi:hypothetical protein